MRCLLVLIAFFLFSAMPNVPQVRALGGQRPAEEHEIVHHSAAGAQVESRDLQAKTVKAKIQISPRRVRSTRVAPLANVLNGHRLANGLLAPLRR